MFMTVGIERSGQEKRILFTYNRKTEIRTYTDEMMILSPVRYWIEKRENELRD